jgi:hypothetical protein
MQKVEGSNPFSRFAEIPLQSGISSFWGWAVFGSVGLRVGRGLAQWPNDWPDEFTVRGSDQRTDCEIRRRQEHTRARPASSALLPVRLRRVDRIFDRFS